MTALDAALAYAARGWPVFPCQPGAKIPATAHGVLDASTDPGQIRAWWTAQPAANVAIATGSPGPDVVDIDVKGDGDGIAALGELAAAGLITGAAERVSTPSGGEHLYFAGSGQRNGSIRGRGVDFRATGGYVLAPPSAVEGKPYRATSGGAIIAGPIDWRIVRDLLDPPPPFQQPPAEHAARNGDRNWPGDDYAARTDWADVLTGWRLMRQIGGVRYWQRPGKTGRGISASTRDDGGLWVFSTSAGFEPETLYTKFGAYALLNGYGKDYKAAAAALRARDYGDQRFLQPGVPAQLAAATVTLHPTGALEMTDFLAQPADEYDWIVPGLIERGDRLILTGEEGKGKSTLLRQLGAQIACGVHPFDGPGFEPVRVLLIDLENSAGQIRRKLQPLAEAAKDTYKAEPGFYILPRPDGIDLLTAADVNWLIEVIEAARPGVLIIGPIYKMIGGSAVEEEPARRASAVLDHIRVTYKLALLIEAHSPYATGRGPRPKRPYGASLWSRWPEFGLYIGGDGRLSHWRGARDERNWPTQLQRGGVWPWMPSTEPRADTWARIADLCEAAEGQLKQRDLAEQIGVGLSTVNRAIQDHRTEWDALAVSVFHGPVSPPHTAADQGELAADRGVKQKSVSHTL